MFWLRYAFLVTALALLVACQSGGVPGDVLSFTFADGEPRVGELVVLEASSSVPVDMITFYVENSADGDEFLGADSRQPFRSEWQAKEGTTVIKLVATRTGQEDIVFSRPVSLQISDDQRPAASFTATAQDGFAPLEVTFDAAPSSDPRGEAITDYRWAFSDDDSSANGAQVSHTFQKVGTHTVTLTVTNESGHTDTATREVTVSEFKGQRWSDPATWGGSLPKAGDTVEILAGEAILMDVSPPALSGLRIEGELIFDDKDLELTSDWVVVEGLLQVGSEAAPHLSCAVITLTGSDPNALTPFGAGIGVKVLGVLGQGRLELHGEPRVSWTRLGATAEKGATQIRLAEASDWRVGETIVIASTDYDFKQAEERVITALRDGGRTVVFEAPLKYMHYGELQTFGGKTLDQRAEVGLLNRNVVVRGEEDFEDSDGLGGHIIARDKATMSVSNVELTRMGQRGIMGRYPIHWHMMGDGARGSYIKNSAIHHLFSRCVTIHGSHGVNVESNVAYDTTGHCYFLEDGNEIDNVLKNNLGLVTRKPAQNVSLLRSDHESQGPTTYWITHPDNTFVGNVAAGSEGSGFWYSLPEQPTGASQGLVEMFNRTVPLKTFKGNTAHSNSKDGLHIDRGPSGHPDGRLQGGAYRPRTDPDDGDTFVTATFENFTGYKNRNRGFWSRGRNHVFTNFMLADNGSGSAMASTESWVKNSVYVGESANKGNPSQTQIDKGQVGLDGRSLPVPSNPAQDIFGFEFYDGLTAVEDTHFENFTPNDQRSAGGISVLHFTAFTLHSTNYAKGVSFAPNTRHVNLPDFTPRMENGVVQGTTGDGYRAAVFIDVDGSVTGKAGADVVIDNPFVQTKTCESHSKIAGASVCTGNDYASLQVITHGGVEKNEVTLTRQENNVSHSLYGAGSSPSNSFRTNILSNRVYSVAANGGLPDNFELRLGDAEGKWIELSIPVNRTPSPNRGREASSLADMRAANETGYFYSNGTLHIKLVGNVNVRIN